MTNREALFFSYDYPPLEGGISRLCMETVKKLAANGWDIEVLSVDRDVGDGFDNSHSNSTRVPFKRGFRELYSFFKLFKTPRSKWIITGIWYPEALLALLAGHKKVVVMAHGNEVMIGRLSVKNSVLSWLRKETLKRAALIICNSHYTERLIKEQIPEAKTVVTLLGVDEKRFCPVEESKSLSVDLGLRKEKRRLLTVSRVDEYKGHDVVLHALAQLTEQEQGMIEYCVAGRGSHLEHLKTLTKTLHIEHCVKWLGFVGEKELPELYNSVDLFVLCTREEMPLKQVEGFGLVFLEAQASGIPVVGTRQGGIPSAVAEGDGGWLIERDDSKALNDIIRKLIDKPELFIEEGKRARTRMEREATWDHFAEKVLNEMDRVVRKYE